MEPFGSMLHLQGLSNKFFLVLLPIFLRSILVLHSHLRLGLPKYLFSVGLLVKILKALLPSSILTIWPAHLNLLDLILLNGTNKKLLFNKKVLQYMFK